MNYQAEKLEIHSCLSAYPSIPRCFTTPAGHVGMNVTRAKFQFSIWFVMAPIWRVLLNEGFILLHIF